MRNAVQAGFVLAVAGVVCGYPAGHAQAGPATARGAVIDAGDGRAVIDWSRGLVVVHAAAAADLRAPSPRIARVKATREARAAAGRRLRKRVRGLRLGARSVAALADVDAGARKRLAQVLDGARELGIDYASDGSVVVEVGVALESVRAAVSGGRAASAGTKPAASATGAPSSVILDARAVLRQPHLGLSVATADRVHLGPTVYYRSVAAALADERAGARALVVRAAPAKAARAVRIDTAAPATLHERRGTRSRRKHDAQAADAYAALAGGALLIVVLGADK